MKKWEVVHDCDDENGNPLCWVSEINHILYGKYIWISANDYGFQIEVMDENTEIGISVLKNCKSLTSAKRWVSTYIK